jgi:hypothetical protein
MLGLIIDGLMLFNGWVHKWALLELSASDRKYTWTNNQDNLVMAKIDRIFVYTEWDSGFPLAIVKCLDRVPSDHNPLVLEFGSNVFFFVRNVLDSKSGGSTRVVF